MNRQYSMNNTIIIYKSKYGTTKQYAQWLADAVNADCCALHTANHITLKKYSTIVFGCSLFAGNIACKSFIKNNIDELKDKKVILYTVSLSDPNTTDFYNIIQQNFDDEIIKQIDFFHLRGGIDYKNLTLLHKIMMYFRKKSVLNKKGLNLNDEEKQFIETYGQVVNFMDEAALKPIIDQVTI